MIGGGKKVAVGVAAPVQLSKKLGVAGAAVLFLNNGTVPVYIGDGQVSPAYGYPCEPLGTLSLPGNSDWYAIADPTAPGPQVVNVIPEGIAATPSAAQIAIQIAAQNLGVNVQNASIPNRPLLKNVKNVAVGVTGIVNLVPGPGPGQSLYLYLLWGLMVQTGGAAGLPYCNITKGGAGPLLYAIDALSFVPTSVDFDGFEVGDNLGIDCNVNFTAGATVALCVVGCTYAVGPTL